MFACVGFIFLSLLELAVVAFHDKLQDMDKKRRYSIHDTELMELNVTMNDNHHGKRKSRVKVGSRRSVVGINIDRASSLLFPLAFAVFNICYWAYYVYKSESQWLCWLIWVLIVYVINLKILLFCVLRTLSKYLYCCVEKRYVVTVISCISANFKERSDMSMIARLPQQTCRNKPTNKHTLYHCNKQVLVETTQNNLTQ